MRLHDVISTLEAIAPPDLQEAYDNAGLIVGDPATALTGVLFCLDSTEAVIDEAVRKGCNLVVAHHPILFRGLKRLNGATYVERTILKAIRHDVAVYAIHTNLDNVHRHGVNERIAQRLGLTDTRLLAPRPGLPGVGAGLLGELPQALDELDFLRMVKATLRSGCVRHTALRGRPVRTVAVCGGAGSFMLPDARRSGADALVTADFKYHEFFDAEGELVIADVGHYESEQYTIELLYDIIREKFPTFALHCTELNTNPVHYL
jgi:dinuclear metal center YbgI/SA1388 family protein